MIRIVNSYNISFKACQLLGIIVFSYKLNLKNNIKIKKTINKNIVKFVNEISHSYIFKGYINVTSNCSKGEKSIYGNKFSLVNCLFKLNLLLVKFIKIKFIKFNLLL